jgi:hypothetical protein
VLRAFIFHFEQRKGTAKASFISTVLDGMEGKEKGFDTQQDFDLRWTANSMYAGRSGTCLWQRLLLLTTRTLVLTP